MRRRERGQQTVDGVPVWVRTFVLAEWDGPLPFGVSEEFAGLWHRFWARRRWQRARLAWQQANRPDLSWWEFRRLVDG